MAELRSYLARYQPRSVDHEALRRDGWREHGVLVVTVDDRRLSWPERELVRQLGDRLHGPRRRAER